MEHGQLIELAELLHKGNYSCVVRNGETLRTFTQPGVLDLYDILTAEPALLAGASVADRAVGKAAAALMLRGGVREIYADLVSEQAIALLADAPVALTYGQKVPHILNRSREGWCPMEQMTRDETSTEKIFGLIEKFITGIRKK